MLEALYLDDDDVWPLQWSQYDAAWMMIDDLDGALEMDDDGPLMEIAYGDGPHTWWSLAWMTMALEALTLDWWSPWWCSLGWCGGALVGDWSCWCTWWWLLDMVMSSWWWLWSHDAQWWLRLDDRALVDVTWWWWTLAWLMIPYLSPFTLP